MGDSGSMLIGLVLAAGAISVTGQVDPDAMKLFAGSEREATHAMLPVFIPLLLPLTIIAIPAADLVLAIVRRTWNGQSPFAADRGHLHHRLLEIGHSHSRAVLIMYFWSALIAFGTVGYSVHSASLWIVLVIVGLSAVGLVLLLMPRFTPRAPRWAERFVPPRYRRRGEEPGAGPSSAYGTQQEPEEAQMRQDEGEHQERRPVVAGVSGVNGATAIGPRSRLPERHKADTAR
jgi:UDP-GlcNAc:undecaprenyl-phosphate GlcNAc-1-phosphate transferase